MKDWGDAMVRSTGNVQHVHVEPLGPWIERYEVPNPDRSWWEFWKPRTVHRSMTRGTIVKAEPSNPIPHYYTARMMVFVDDGATRRIVDSGQGRLTIEGLPVRTVSGQAVIL